MIVVNSRKINVFVLLSYGVDAAIWERLWKEGKIIGINEPKPYGYYRADGPNIRVEYSKDRPEMRLERIFRRAFHFVLGFDLIHAWHNFDAIRRADIVWTHQESQFLSILLLLRFFARANRPKLIAQCIWLFDRWDSFSSLRKRFFSGLIEEADIITTHSPANLAVARRLFPKVRSELVRFGISIDNKTAPIVRKRRHPLRIISLGNDEHRDWKLLISAVTSNKNWSLTIISHRVNPTWILDSKNVTISLPTTNDEFFELFRCADLLVLALKPNLHASGVTVIQEAALLGVPVVCSNTGGLEAYFSDDQVVFVPPENEVALTEAITHLAENPDKCFKLATNAQAQMSATGLSSQSYVHRHVELTRELLGLVSETGSSGY